MVRFAIIREEGGERKHTRSTNYNLDFEEQYPRESANEEKRSKKRVRLVLAGWLPFVRQKFQRSPGADDTPPTSLLIFFFFQSVYIIIL